MRCFPKRVNLSEFSQVDFRRN